MSNVGYGVDIVSDVVHKVVHHMPMQRNEGSFPRMESAAQISEISSDRRLLPRSQVGRTHKIYDGEPKQPGRTADATRAAKLYHHQYRFQIGQHVQWGDEVWTVVGRQTSAMGRRFYTVTREGDERPVRTTIEVVLAPIA